VPTPRGLYALSGVALGTSQVDYNGRFCMSSAVNRSFGVDPSSCTCVACSTAARVAEEHADWSLPARTWWAYLRKKLLVTRGTAGALVAGPIS